MTAMTDTVRAAAVHPANQTSPSLRARMAELHADADAEMAVYVAKANRGDVSAELHRDASERLRAAARACLDQIARDAYARWPGLSRVA